MTNKQKVRLILCTYEFFLYAYDDLSNLQLLYVYKLIWLYASDI